MSTTEYQDANPVVEFVREITYYHVEGPARMYSTEGSGAPRIVKKKENDHDPPQHFTVTATINFSPALD